MKKHPSHSLQVANLLVSTILLVAIMAFFTMQKPQSPVGLQSIEVPLPDGETLIIDRGPKETLEEWGLSVDKAVEAFTND